MFGILEVRFGKCSVCHNCATFAGKHTDNEDCLPTTRAPTHPPPPPHTHKHTHTHTHTHKHQVNIVAVFFRVHTLCN